MLNYSTQLTCPKNILKLFEQFNLKPKMIHIAIVAMFTKCYFTSIGNSNAKLVCYTGWFVCVCVRIAHQTAVITAVFKFEHTQIETVPFCVSRVSGFH